MEKILSVSVATYNVEQFIKQNLDSFVNSEVRDDIEVLVTDDGSKDNTPSIVAEYEEKYPGIVKLIKQKNAGPRLYCKQWNKKCQSENILEWQIGDDWVDTENLKAYIEFLKNNDVDMCVTPYTTVDNDTGAKERHDIPIEPKNTVIEPKEGFSDFEFQMHNVTYKTKILKENNIVLDNGFYTDVEYLLLPFPYIKKVAFIDTNIYMYRISLSTQSVNISSMQKNIAMLDSVFKRMIEYYEESKEENIDGNMLACMKRRLVEMATTEQYVLISFKANKENKNRVKDLYNHIKNTSKDIYDGYAKVRATKLLKYSRFTAYSMLSARCRKKNNLK